jgi:hypothetical protein
VYDRQADTDVAVVDRQTQARALADGLNDGELVIEHGRIVTAAEAAAR